MRESSKVKIRNIFKKIYYPAFENVYLDTITYTQIQTVLNESAKNGKSFSYIETAIIYGKKFFKYAKVHSLIKENPITERLENNGRKPDRTKVKHWTFDQLQLFLKTAKEKEMDLQNYCCIYVLMHTGIRIGEYFALTWDDIDFENGIIRIHKSLAKNENKTLYRGDVKTPSSFREVYINDECIEVLKEWKKENKYNILYPNVKNGKHIQPTSFNRKLNIYLEKYEIEGLPRITPHGFRHSVGTYHINNGANPADVAELLGHKDTNVTFKTYTHSTKEGVKKLANKMKFN